MSLKKHVRLKHQLRIFKVLAQGCSRCPYTGTCMPSWNENQWEKLESGRGGWGPKYYPLLLSFWLNFLASGHKAPFNSHTHVCKIRTYFASEGVMQLPIHRGLGKAAVTISSTRNLVSHDQRWVFCTQRWSYRTGAQEVVTCPNAQQPQPAALSSDRSHHVPSPRIFFPMTASSRIIKERYFLVVSPLPLVTVLHNQGNQQAFTLSLAFVAVSLNTDSKIILISIPKKQIVAFLTGEA